MIGESVDSLTTTRQIFWKMSRTRFDEFGEVQFKATYGDRFRPQIHTRSFAASIRPKTHHSCAEETLATHQLRWPGRDDNRTTCFQLYRGLQPTFWRTGVSDRTNAT